MKEVRLEIPIDGEPFTIDVPLPETDDEMEEFMMEALLLHLLRDWHALGRAGKRRILEDFWEVWKLDVRTVTKPVANSVADERFESPLG